MEFDFSYVALAIIGCVMGSIYGRPLSKDERLMLALVLCMVVLLGFLWQRAHHWPGISALFLFAMGTYAATFALGAAVGRLFRLAVGSFRRRTEPPPSRL